MEFREIGCSGMDWNNVTQERGRGRAVMNMTMNLRGSTKCWVILQ
jgi:hypothetical protein